MSSVNPKQLSDKKLLELYLTTDSPNKFKSEILDRMEYREFVDALVEQFPGLIDNTDVNEADLVDWISNNLRR